MSTDQTRFSKNISKEIMNAYLPSNPIIVEAGAHIGRDTLKMKKKWPQCTIHAFEPVDNLFSTLTANTINYSDIHCYHYALSSQTGQKTLYVSSGRSTATSSLFKPSGYLNEHPETIFTPATVETITLDDWAKKNSISYIDMLWLDMQGGELDALYGAQELLLTLSVIYTEVSLHERYENTPLYPEVKAWLENKGFKVAQEALPDTQWGNVLFVKNN